MKTWSKRIIICLSGLILFVIIGVIALPGTRTGTQFLFSTLEKQLDGQLRIGSIKGTLLGRLELTDVRVDNPMIIAQAGRLVLDWTPSDVLHLQLRIVELAAGDISLQMLPQEQTTSETEKSPLTLPELTLPITIALDVVKIENFVFRSAPDAGPVTVDNAELALSWKKNGIEIQRLDVNMPAVRIHGAGLLDPTGNYALQVETQGKTQGADVPSLQLDGNYSGDLQNLVIQQRVRGDIDAELAVTVTEIINNPGWKGNLKIRQLQPSLFAPQVPGTLTGELQSQGDLQLVELTGSLSMRDADTVDLNWDADLDMQADLKNLFLTINQILLTPAEAKATVALSGTIDRDRQLDLSLNWQNLQWPVVEDAEYSSNQGTLIVKGHPDDYQLILNTEVDGTQLPAGDWKLTAKGNTKGAVLTQFTGNTMEGEVTVRGDVQWSPEITWNLTTEGRNINPAALNSEWPGSLTWKITSDGTLEENGVTATVLLEQLGGVLRDLPVAAKGTIELVPEHIAIDDLQISSGDAVFTARGNLDNASQIDWNLNVPDFSELLPHASGQLSGRGMLKGEMRRPQVTTQLYAQALVLPQLALEQFQADASFDLSWAQPFSLKFSGTGLQLNNQRVEKFTLQGDGTREQHTIALTANHSMAKVQVDLQGGYRENQWQGRLKTFNIDSKELKSWHLLKPVQISASPTAATLNTMCLQRERADLCANGTWNAESTEKTQAELQLREFPLSLLSPWFPETVQSLDGLFSANASMKMKNGVQADLTADITPGSIGYLTENGDGTLPHQGGKLQLHIQENALNGNFLLSVDSNTIGGTFSSPDLLKENGLADTELVGELKIDAQKLNIIEAFLPEIQELSGSLTADFTIDGSLTQPEIKGNGALDIGHLAIPVIGLELNTTTLHIEAKNNDLQVKGEFKSTEGSLKLNGQASLDSTQNRPVRITLSSDNFKLINLPEAQVYLTSNLLLEKKNETLLLSGELTVPKADILLRDLPEGAESVSPDVIVLQEEKKEEEQKSPLQMQLKVTLGKDVHFVGLGLNCFIDGQLALTAEPDKPMLGSGEFRIQQGTYRAYGQNLNIETGVLSFPGGPLSQPGIVLRATRTIGDVVVGIRAVGPARKPRLTTFSNPSMSQSKVISYLLTGSAGGDSGQGTMLSVGRQINNKLSVSMGTDIKTGEKEFITRYRLSRKIHIQTTTATNNNAADIFYTMEFGSDKEQGQEQGK